jgi:peptidoglycan hydrolase-like protein with peptidoglycan-binding domain
VPTTDLSSPGPWLEARRRSRARRADTARRRRRLRLSRGAASALLAGMTLAAGAALAHDQVRTSRSSSSSARTGGTVVALQRALGIPADGVYGPQTAAAVRSFQRRQGLAVDGVAGPATLAALGRSGSAATAQTSQGGSSSGALVRIAQCESGGDPTAVSASGTYRGKYQFSRATWQDLGGSGDPAAASEAEQDRIAAKLYAQRGTAPWPVCGAKA